MKNPADSSRNPRTAPPRIRILRDDVINKIAAGEVIERPAAVVKELLENSLDAGATRIEVEFRHGGKSLIRIEDNGCGMSPDDALLALERHATSKLRDPDDLLRITSMGFRGEALPSIASISRFTLQSRPAQQPEGTEILVNGGKMIHRRACGMAPGTRIEVANLFHAVPARRKFLKTDNTEAAHIVHLVRLHAMARPEVDFSLIEDGRPVFRSPRGKDLRQRVAEIWGEHLASPLEILPEAKAKGLHLHGLIGRPGTGRSSRREIITLVNRRPVDSPTLAYALIEGCHSFIPKGRYPLAFLFLDIDPAAVDINVHPAKREIRFRDEGSVRRFVIENVAARMSNLARMDPLGSGPALPAEDSAALAAANLMASRQGTPTAPEATPDRQPSPAPAPKVLPSRPLPTSTPPAAHPQVSSASPPASPPATPASAPQPTASTGAPASPSWRLLGRLSEGLAVFETPAGLVMLHLKAAQMRVAFEELEDRFQGEDLPSQALLIPHPLEFDQISSAALEEHRAFLEKHGFTLEPFGRNFYRLTAHPTWLPQEAAVDFLRDLISALREGKIDPARNVSAREAMARMAASRRQRPGDRPGDDEVRLLVTRLLRCRQPLICPEGRPTFFEIPRREIQKRLGLT